MVALRRDGSEHEIAASTFLRQKDADGAEDDVIEGGMVAASEFA